MEESGRRESFAPTYGVHINPVSKGKQIPLCSSGQGCTHEGGPFQRPPIDCTDLNYRTLKKSLFSIHHTTSLLATQWDQMTKPAKPKIREINWSSIFDEFFWYEVHGMTGNGSYVYLLKNPPKIREISISSLCLATVWRFFWIWSAWCNDRKRKLCEFTETCFWKIREITSAGEIIFGGCHFETLCSTLDNYYIEASIEKSSTVFAENW